MEAGDEGIERVEDSKDLQQQSKALDKLTDHVEDRQLNSTRVQEVFLLTYCYFDYIYIYTYVGLIMVVLVQAMASIAASKEADWNAMRMRYCILIF